MRGIIRKAPGFLFVLLLPAIAPQAARAEVTRVEISSRQDVLNGKSFGTVGAYEKLSGKVYFAVDPNNPHNKIIADVDKAPKNSQGNVEFSADLFILRPKDSSRGNGVALFDIVNRGRIGVFSAFNRGSGSANPSTEADFGDGLLMREGYTIVAVGWEFEVAKGKNLIGLQAPIATDNGQPITGWINPWFIPDKSSGSYEYTTEYNTDVYPPLNPKDSAYLLTAREGWVATPHLIPREDWQFGKMENGQVSFDPNWLTVKGGFKAGMTYQLKYETKNPPVAGLGFAALRDLASAVKNNSDAVVHARLVYTYGASQVGRYQRQLVYEGFTTDEQGRQAIDALFIHTGGTSFGSFNKRFALPNELGSFTETVFPIRYEVTTDPERESGTASARASPPARIRRSFLWIQDRNIGIAGESPRSSTFPWMGSKTCPIRPTCGSLPSRARSMAPARGLPPTFRRSRSRIIQMIIDGRSARC